MVYLLNAPQAQCCGMYTGSGNHRKHWKEAVSFEASTLIPERQGFAACICYFE